jgi:hypothetical protein
MKQKINNKCEECRDLQKELKTNHIVNNTYVYGQNKERFYIEQGKAIKVCSIYNCNNDNNCQEHINNIIECQ